MIFDLSSNSPAQRAIIENALSHCTFNFDQLLQGLKTQTGKTAIPVTWKDLSKDQAYGLAWSDGRVEIDLSLEADPAKAMETFIFEGGAHMCDFFFITPAQRKAIYKAYHPAGVDTHGWFEESGNKDYWSWTGEAWMFGFLASFTDLPVSKSSFTHTLSAAGVQQVRLILGASAPPAPPAGTPSGPDAVLAGAVRPWVGARHSGSNLKAAKAVQVWLDAKGV